MPANDRPPDTHQKIDPPPFLGTWGKLYSAVLIYLALLIILLSFAGRWLNPNIG